MKIRLGKATQRAGGLSEMRRIGALASGYEIPLSMHIFTEYSLSIAGSEANCIAVEHMPWNAPLFNESVEIKEGMIALPENSGTGFSFDKQAITRFSVGKWRSYQAGNLPVKSSRSSYSWSWRCCASTRRRPF